MPDTIVVVSNGVATCYGAGVDIVDLDNIKAGDPPYEFPRGVGYEPILAKAVEYGGLEEGKHFVWVDSE